MQDRSRELALAGRAALVSDLGSSVRSNFPAEKEESMTYAGASVIGKVVLVTGGGTGIGAAVAERYTAEGAKVVVIGRRREPLEEVAARTGATVIVADAADSASAQAAVDQVVATLGRIDVLVNNAGGHGFAPVGETDDAGWAASLQANLNTAFVMSRAALPALMEAKGQIVVISSLAGLFAGPSVAGYTVGKHALIGLTKSLARDYGRHGVRVNAVCPGWVRTPMADAEMDEFADHAGLADRAEAYGRVTRDVPLQRPAQPSEIASVVRFLGSGESSYITGATLVMDGGAHIVDLPTIAFDHAGM
jgi:NAD(P)-dependent dehydrogenase (short-subunit alcohol dehydrogenase family)